MSLVEIRAKFTCDECGKPFSVEIEPSSKPPTQQIEGMEWSMYEMAEDAVRGSLGAEQGGDYVGLIKSVSVQNGKHLCVECTEVADEKEEV